MTPPLPLSILILLIFTSVFFPRAASKSSIEPCSNSGACSALVGYTLYTDLKVSEVASLFSVDPISLLLANAIDISYPDVENHILPSQLFLKIPISCSCVDGIRKSSSVTYKTRPSDTLVSISSGVYGGLVSADQIKEANPSAQLSDPSVIPVATQLNIPLHCTCFNNSDNNLPAVYLSYVVRNVDTLAAIAGRYATTVSDLMNVNSLGSVEIEEEDILAIPLSACASNFPATSTDYGLVVPNGSYAITASHCVQCSCGPASRNLYCMPASMAVSCSSMQCRNSNLMVGNKTIQQTSGGCNVNSCDYSGFINGTIATTLSTSFNLDAQCFVELFAGVQQFPRLIAPTTLADTNFSPAPSPTSELGGIPSTSANPRSSVVPSSNSIGFPPVGDPCRSISGSSSSDSCSLVNSFIYLPITLALGFLSKFALPISL